MRYAEFSELSESQQARAVEKLTGDQVRDLIDEFPLTHAPLNKKDNAIYFDSIDNLHAYMRHNVVPESRPWEAIEAANHELAHADCALKLGALGVAYYVLDAIDLTDRTRVYASICGPVTMPSLADAAISMHPHNASRSLVDTRSIRELGYASRDDVARRIDRWNDRLGDELWIPEPQTEYINQLQHLE